MTMKFRAKSRKNARDIRSYPEGNGRSWKFLKSLSNIYVCVCMMVFFFLSIPVVRRLIDSRRIEPRWNSFHCQFLITSNSNEIRSANDPIRGSRLFRARLKGFPDVDFPRFHQPRALSTARGHAGPVPSAGYIRLLGIQMIARPCERIRSNPLAFFRVGQ